LNVRSSTDPAPLVDHMGQIIPSLYGMGIAFPERVIDIDGSSEEAVGLWKFMRHAKRIIPHLLSPIATIANL